MQIPASRNLISATNRGRGNMSLESLLACVRRDLDRARRNVAWAADGDRDAAGVNAAILRGCQAVERALRLFVADLEILHAEGPSSLRRPRLVRGLRRLADKVGARFEAAADAARLAREFGDEFGDDRLGDLGILEAHAQHDFRDVAGVVRHVRRLLA
jgi:hypothetical protein